ncbi:GNAT family N-acetyltransferase [Liquorilactobacillus mali]|uniref:Acetyltransferase n=1 Tax=Liquorilactobacillus mali TaxID=1618 RepID=A0A0R2FES2_9LACO|nr:GNAT family N-acetyltransferase [Liquorilactobacillus mali]KRN27011.1 acetyltransferase [Liquorilactobacillus mali]MDN7144978.1 GNAT family N-acetyltransferase [Liquorilactobacillus mali]
MNLKIINKDNEKSLLLKNNAFDILGEMVVRRTDEKWDYEIRKYDTKKVRKQVFPDEKYNLEDINKNGFAIGAFNENETIGLAIFNNNWNGYLYLEDLKVNEKDRRKGVAHSLLKFAEVIAKGKKYKGIWTVGQNNNLAACKFYLKYGFEIGGLDTRVYKHTSQKGKQDIHFYYDFT